LNRILKLLRRPKVTLPEPEPPPADTGARDAAMRGWFNHATGELCPGFPVSAGDVAADIGCGGGEHAYFCATLGTRVILADIDPGGLEHARMRLSN
jgi:2-polyprenyl-3-methyl-5-hydroxy-6-metoxy-1,4-benzoquinol methylase